MTLVAIFSMVNASVIPSLEPRATTDDKCSKFNDPRVESLCEAACKEYGKETDYILGQCGRKGICECKEYEQ
ncbi:hypothetical protein INT45_012890 [Circinella minor]|uniref:Uncharacterized protein n=1 Tax=Circinella minor TaxID=1195481 RepID=A0A8H7S805_9FUNG|nr:hypothetical protein INT45_012890 [Circinella minor]